MKTRCRIARGLKHARFRVKASISQHSRTGMYPSDTCPVFYATPFIGECREQGSAPFRQMNRVEYSLICAVLVSSQGENRVYRREENLP